MLDAVRLNFSADALVALNVLLAAIMFGIALDLDFADFRRVSRRPRALITGLLSQWLVLPAVTLVLVMLVAPPPSIALGMIIVAACPGGSVSNFFSHLARGDVALSVTMSAITSSFAFLATPLNIALWGSVLPETRELLRSVEIDVVRMLLIVVLVLVVPTIAGCWLATRRQAIAQRLRLPFRRFSMLVFAGFVIAAFAANWSLFVEWAEVIAGVVMLHNGAALAAGFLLATLVGLPPRVRRSVTIETGIQNSALGLTLIFAFFDGLGGMALVAGWWGVWHLVSGAALARFWGVRDVEAAPA